MSYRSGKKFYTVLAILVTAVCLLAVLTHLTENNAVSAPGEKAVPLENILGKETLTAEDYDLIFNQTGLGESAAKALLAEKNGKERLLKEQKLFLEPPPYRCNDLTGLSMTEGITKKVDFYGLYDLRPGDVVLTKSTHTLCYRHGHSALCIDKEHLLEATAIGEPVAITTAAYWGSYPTGIHLRIKEEAAREIGMTGEELGKAVAAYAEKEFLNDDYSLLAGAFGKGIDTDETQCAHLIREAFLAFGIETSSAAFPATPHSLLTAGKFEIIRFWGFDPDRIDW